jgi:hypothetical protein
MKATYNKLKDWDLCTKFESVMKKTCRFHEPRLDNTAIFGNLHQCVVTLDKVSSDLTDIQIIFLELSQMIVEPLTFHLQTAASMAVLPAMAVC